MANRPDPREMQTADEFARALNALRAESGQSLRALTLKLQKALAAKKSGQAPTFTTLGGWFSGAHLPTPKLTDVLPELLELCGVTNPDEIAEWRVALERVRSAPGPRRADAPSPFRGLAVYEPAHARYFHGRDSLTGRLLSMVAHHHAAGGVIVVVGPSGSGKSSLLQPGLIPALDQGRSSLDSGQWGYLLFTPGASPLRELARNIADLAGSSAETVETKLAADPRSAVELVRRTASHQGQDPSPDHKMLIIVDQFEELFTSGADESEKAAFVEALCSAAERKPGSEDPPAAAVVLGLRADFYAQALVIPGLLQALQDAQLVVGPMTRDELREAITRPAREEKVGVEEGLVELIMRELAPPAGVEGAAAGAAHEAGALPFLSHALLATWEYAKAPTLKVENYVAAGGIHGAIAKTAEAAFDALPDAQQDVARRIFLRLVRVGDDIADTRRKVQRSALVDSGSDPDSRNFEDVLNQFIGARLITVNDDTVEITHESLLTAWPRLATWLGTDRQWIDMHHRLNAAASEWASNDRDPDLLYRGGNLQMVQEQAADADRSRELNLLESEFLGVSVAREADEHRARRRRGRRLYQFTAALAAVIVGAAGTVAYFRQAALVSERRSAQVLLSRLVASEADRVMSLDVPLGMQLALIAYRISPTSQARSSLIDATDVPAATQVPALGGPVNEVAVSRHGSLLAQGTDPGTVQLWDIARSGALTRAGPDLRSPAGSIDSLAFGPGGRLLAAAGTGAANGLYLWNTAIPSRPVGLTALPGAGSSVSSVAISPNGHILAAALGNNRVGVWDITSPAHPTLTADLGGPDQPVTSVVFSPDGRMLAAGSQDSRVYLWSLAHASRPSPLATLAGPYSQIFSIAISPDGRYLAAGTGAQHNVYLWHISNPARPAREASQLNGPDGYVNSVAFSPDGAVLAAASADGQVWLYGAATHALIRQLPHSSPVTDVAFRNDQSLVTVSTNGADGVIRIWQIPGPVITSFRDSVFAVTFDASGNRLGVAPGLQDNSVSIWNVTNTQNPIEIGQRIVDHLNSDGFSGSGALSPDGDTFAVGCINGAVQLWNVTNPRDPHPYRPPISAGTQLIQSIDIGAGGLMAAGSSDGTVHLWSIADPRHPVQLSDLNPRASGYVLSTAFSPDAHLIAVADSNNDVYLWNITDPLSPHLEATLTGFAGAAYSAVFANRGEILAAGSADDTVRLWNVAKPAHPHPLVTLTGPVSVVYALAFDPIRDVLAAGSTDGTIWLWKLTTPHAPAYLATLNGPVRGVFTVTFSPNGRTLVAGGQDQTVHLWDSDPASAAAWICATVGQSITKHQWKQFVPTKPYAPPCGLTPKR